MTAPYAGTWAYTYDAASGVIPAAGGTVTTSPTPIGGSVAGGSWAAPGGNARITDVVTAPRLTAWLDVQAVTEVGTLCTYVSVTDYTGNVGFLIVRLDGLYYSSNGSTILPAALADMTSFHEVGVVLDGAMQTLYLDGVNVGSYAAYAAGVNYAFLNSSGLANIRGFALAAGVQPPSSVSEGPVEALPEALSMLHLGADGLAVDFDDVSHYANQLTAAQVLDHYNVAKGLA